MFQDPVAEDDNKADKQLNGELKDKINEDEDEDERAATPAKEEVEEDEEVKAKGEEVDDIDADDDDERGEEYNVESIADHKITKGKILYWIKWQGYDEDQNTWEPEEHLLPYVWHLPPQCNQTNSHPAQTLP